MKNNPNTIAAGVGGLGPGLLVIWLAGHFGLHMGAEVGGVIAVLFSSLFVFICREGLLGLWRQIIHGSRR